MMNKAASEQQLKLLASKLPELVYITVDKNIAFFTTGCTVTDREMDWLIRQAEEKLTVNELSIYADNLDAICVPTHICPLTHWQAVILSTWQQRLEALCRVWEQENNL